MSLETIFAQAKVVKIGNNDIEIKQVALQDIPFVLEIVSKVMDGKKDPIKDKILKLIKDDFDSVITLFVRMTNLKVTEVSTLNLAASLQIFTKIIEENKDFLLVHLPESMEKLKAAMGGSSKSKS